MSKKQLSPDLLKRLITNALKTLLDAYYNEGCNDIFDDEPVLKGISKNELKQIEEIWIQEFPVEAKESDNELIFNTQILDLLVKLSKK